MQGRWPHLRGCGWGGARPGDRGGGDAPHRRRAAARPRRPDPLRRGEAARAPGEGARQEPKLLLLDEPTANLDPGHQVRILGRVAGEARGRAGGPSRLPRLGLAASYADRVLVLREGRSSRRVSVGSPHGGPPASGVRRPLLVEPDRARAPRIWLDAGRTTLTRPRPASVREEGLAAARAAARAGDSRKAAKGPAGRAQAVAGERPLAQADVAPLPSLKPTPQHRDRPEAEPVVQPHARLVGR